MKENNNLQTMHGLRNDIVLVLPELLDRILHELESINRRLKRLENKKLSNKESLNKDIIKK